MSTDSSRSMRLYSFVLAGQLLSILGSALGGFALGVWIYEKTGSVTEFALISFFGALPGLLLTPLAGVLVDRWDRRWIMAVSDFGAAFCTLGVVLLAAAGRLDVWHVYTMVVLITAFGAFQRPALGASTVLMVPRRQLGRVNGIVQATMAVVDIAAPILAGFLIARIQLRGIMAIDFATFLLAGLSVLLVRIPHPPRQTRSGGGLRALLREAREGWSFLAGRPGLLTFLFLSSAINACLALVTVLLTPLVLSFADVKVLGTVMAAGSSGVLAGGVLMAVWRGPERRMPWIFGAFVLQGILLVISGLRADATLILVCSFLFLALTPILNTCSGVFWQIKTPAELQGRTFAARRLVVGVALPLSYLAAGPLADRVFEPWMAQGGALAGSAGRLIGVGPGRGIALLFMVLGASIVLMALAAWVRLRHLETEVPDAIPTEPPAAADVQPLEGVAVEAAS